MSSGKRAGDGGVEGREGGTDQAGPGAEAAPPASPRRFAVVLVTLGAAVLSAALLLFPREDERPATAAADEVSPRRGLRGQVGPGVAGRYLRESPSCRPEALGTGLCLGAGPPTRGCPEALGMALCRFFSLLQAPSLVQAPVGAGCVAHGAGIYSFLYQNPLFMYCYMRPVGFRSDSPIPRPEGLQCRNCTRTFILPSSALSSSSFCSPSATPFHSLVPGSPLLPPASIFQRTPEHADSHVAGSFDRFPSKSGAFRFPPSSVLCFKAR